MGLKKGRSKLVSTGTAMYYSGIALLVAIFGTPPFIPPIWFCPHRLAKKITDGAETNFPHV